MKRLSLATALVLMIMVPPLTDAQSSGGSASSGGGVQGKITSVTTTNFALTRTSHRHGRSRGRTKSTVVHYNPDSVSITVDGVAVHSLDVAATGKYVNVIGTMKNNVLEATSIVVTSAPQAQHKKSASQ